ncbi:hypothetical protein Bca101_023623 [Brassica carinata]
MLFLTLIVLYTIQVLLSSCLIISLIIYNSLDEDELLRKLRKFARFGDQIWTKWEGFMRQRNKELAKISLQL